MTCIVAVESINESDLREVWFGADSCVGGQHTRVLGRPKIWKKGEFLFGASGYLRSLQLMGYTVNLPLPMDEQDPYHYMINTLSGCVRRSFVDSGNLYRKDGIQKMDTSFLIGFRGKIYYMGTTFAVDDFINGYGAIGSGSSYALGSLYTTRNDTSLSPAERLTLALGAASEYDSAVSEPYEIIGLRWHGFEDGDKYVFIDNDGAEYNYILENERKEG